MSAPVFLADPGRLDGSRPGDQYVLEGGEARHAGVVQRRRAGERVDVVDSAGVRLHCRISTVEPGRLVLDIEQRTDEPTHGVHLVLVQALAKGDRDEMAIEASTEVGVDAVIPWQAGRSVVVWRGERAAKSRARWLARVRQAAKQSRRAFVPEVGHAVDTPGLVALVEAAVATGGRALVLHEEARLPLAAVDLPSDVRPTDDAAPREVLVVVGPEGGISADEVEALVGAGALAVRLGPHVLRTSTAGPVAVALLAERLGRWT
ncbi:16S rRNA (uracil(1498)-N(3))-methyltransferase [Actinotalea sp. K2]|uniref:16S rRNA (uracil(1498)-N(3))-methyltransferase n=1 Tax=Actinotalea sp. K2 TaxID=2939438 RepID=UPI002016B85C|nr:16S rRNA (uracil(1498)-N(3))-methyltransferase [Actinotalea sp. K2]MCL3860591.1 16S rRNA (uracil(1498)-N(3))-methyltransferase [Actinotalea sp. K2]